MKQQTWRGVGNRKESVVGRRKEERGKGTKRKEQLRERDGKGGRKIRKHIEHIELNSILKTKKMNENGEHMY